MTTKNIVLAFYKSDVFLDTKKVSELLHPDVTIDWNTTKGVIQMKFDDIISLSSDLAKAYVRSKIKISHIVHENNMVSLRYSHIVKTIENPREDMLLANFFVIWEVKDGKLFKGFQMSHIS
ncbi:nuclear transport factor 2 family protein [Flavobacterium cellulosilyticum]|uniref:Nuclear transport factor 2 family protein n=1 Tax=Flavobacterium cellulosilyticum TaxID=2541731 RepID=A0A4V2YYX6_9FLAO|nr:nuclear transport factor 2 family protein [Flavobacterium cellulosilyticum]TDD94927.1 nuclear transport factor 2 family protein [Flavobacterium cellulosilyticum]